MEQMVVGCGTATNTPEFSLVFGRMPMQRHDGLVFQCRHRYRNMHSHQYELNGFFLLARTELMSR